jgi:hypothetical protein
MVVILGCGGRLKLRRYNHAAGRLRLRYKVGDFVTIGETTNKIEIKANRFLIFVENKTGTIHISASALPSAEIQETSVKTGIFK